jgi:hypothetical protein
LANNGARYYSYNRILNCKEYSFSLDFLISNLGKPNMVRENNAGVEYVYFCLDAKKMPETFPCLTDAYISPSVILKMAKNC